MGSYGLTNLTATGAIIMVSADGFPEWKHGGVTIDWSTVTAVGSDTVLADGVTVKTGDKYLRYGQVLNRITASGKYGPADTSLANGQQTTAEGQSYVLNQTVLLSELGSDHPPVFDGGKVWSARLLVGGTNQPTLTALKTALPRLKTITETA